MQLAGFAALFFTASLLSLGQGAVTSLIIQKGAAYGFSEIFLGAVISVGYAGFIAGNYLMRYLLRRVAYIRAFAVCAAAVAVFALALPVLPEKAAWLALRFLHGLFFSSATIICEGWVSSKTARENRSRVLGMYMTVSYISYGLSQYALLIESPAFAFSAAAACMMLSLVPVCLTRFPEPQQPDAGGGGVSLSLVDVYRIAPVAFVGQFGVGILTSGGWLFVRYAESLELDAEGVALMSGLFFSSGFVLQVPMGWLSDRAGDRRDVISGVAGLSAVFAFALFWGDLLPFFAIAAMTLVFGALFNTLFALNVAYGQDFVQREKAPEYSGRLFQSYAVGALLGPVVIGWLMEVFSPAWLFLVCGAVLCAMTAAAATTRLMPKLRPAKSEQHQLQTPLLPAEQREVYNAADIGPPEPETEDGDDDNGDSSGDGNSGDKDNSNPPENK